MKILTALHLANANRIENRDIISLVSFAFAEHQSTCMTDAIQLRICNLVYAHRNCVHSASNSRKKNPSNEIKDGGAAKKENIKYKETKSTERKRDDNATSTTTTAKQITFFCGNLCLGKVSACDG